MPPIRILALLAALFVVAGCGAEPARLAVDPLTSAMNVRSAARSVMVGEVRLPEYAEAPEVTIEAPSGLLEVIPDVIWADVPSDALSASLVRNLSAITGARVAAEPWPLDEFPDAEVTVRVERMLLRANGLFSLTGQYAIRRDQGRGVELIRAFDIAVPLQNGDLNGLARAQSAAWLALAEAIAPAL